MTTVNPLQTQINSVIALYSNGQIQEALDSVKTLTKSYPNEPLLYNISGVCYKAIGQLDAAVKNFEKALAIKPDYAEAYNNLGNICRETVNRIWRLRTTRRHSLLNQTTLWHITTLV